MRDGLSSIIKRVIIILILALLGALCGICCNAEESAEQNNISITQELSSSEGGFYNYG